MAWHSPTMLPGPCSLFFQTCRAISQGCTPVLLSQTATTQPTKRDTVRTRAQYHAHAHSITATTLPTLLEQCNCVFSGTSLLLCACWFFHGQRRYVSVLVVDVFYLRKKNKSDFGLIPFRQLWPSFRRVLAQAQAASAHTKREENVKTYIFFH